MAKPILGFFLFVALALPANARPAAEAGTPKQIASLLACRPLTDPAQRLACLDRELARLESAIAAKNLVVVDRARVREAKQGLFGFSIPSFGGLFGGSDEDDVKQVDGTVANASRNPEGGWTVRLADGSTWTQTDDTPVALAPKRGTKVIIKRAALGSFKLNFENQPSVRVKRIG